MTQAPNKRLDRTLQYDRVKAQIKQMTLPEMMNELGLLSKEKINKYGGLRAMQIKGDELRLLTRSFIRIHYIEEFKKKLVKLLHELKCPNVFMIPDKWRSMVALDKVVRLYIDEKIQRNCHNAAHERLFSDTTKLQTFKFSYLF